MKKCTYCGKEYPDEVTVCEIDANPLISTKGAKASPAHAVKLTGLDKLFSDSSSMRFLGVDVRLLWGVIGVLACKHPKARKNAWIYLGWQLGGFVLAFIIAMLILSVRAK